MKLFKSEVVRDALGALAKALEAEAAAAGEEIKTLVVTSFTVEDEDINNTSIYGCDCSACLERARRSVLAVLDGTAHLQADLSMQAH